MEVKGLKEIMAALSEVLDRKNLNYVVGSSIRKGLNQVIIKPIKSALPYSAQTKSGVSIIRNKKKDIEYIAGIIAKKRDKKNPDALPAGVILRFLEGGTKVRQVNGQNRGKIDPRPIVSPIIANGSAAMISFLEKDFQDTIMDQIDKKMKSLKNK
jgi:hypothetical protein